MADPNMAQKRSSSPGKKSASLVTGVEVQPTSSASQPFIYDDLKNEGDIRLLKLLPAGLASDAVACQLVHVSVSEKPLYAAISYTWETLEGMGEILIDGRPLPILKRVEQLLKLLRSEEYVRTLWIDCVCICQTNDQERSSQVRLMGDIFAGASYVLSWLEEFGNVSDPLNLLLHLLGRTRLPYEEFEILTSFLEHKYWTRRWVVQELLLARSVFLVSGQSQVPLSKYINRFQTPPQIDDYGNEYFERRIGTSPFMRLFSLGSQPPQTNSRSLGDALYIHRDTECSEIMDQVYALASLSKKAKQHMKIDYSIDRELLVLAVLDFCVEHEGLERHRWISLLSLLRRQLKINDGKLHQIYNAKAGKLGLPIIGNRPWDSLIVRRRGIIRDAGLNSFEFEEHVHYCRPRMPPLRKIVETPLYQDKEQQPHYFEIRPKDGHETLDLAEPISGHDLFAFTFTDDSIGVYLGLSSSWLEVGDELWQFCRTPIAIIVRKSSSIVGRAYILKRSQSHDYYFGSSLYNLTLEELLDFSDGKSEDPKNWANYMSDPEVRLGISVPAVMNLLKWIDFDY